MGRTIHSLWRVLWESLVSLAQQILKFCGGIFYGHNKRSTDDEEVPVQVFILMGQSNMLGMGHVQGKDKDGTLEYAVFHKKLYQYLIDSASKWATSKTVRNVRVMDGKHSGPMAVYDNEFMTIKGSTIGPEFGIGHYLEEHYKDKPVIVLKSCIGNRSLGWDLLPPGSPRYEYKGDIYAGYKDHTDKWPKGTEPPPPAPDSWYAGKQYDSDVANAKTVLADLDTYYPGAKSYEVAGFFWWQGDKDRYSESYCVRYETNLCRLIAQLRTEFDCPDAKFVLATLGQTDINNDDDPKEVNDKKLLDAMLAVDGNSGKHPEFVGKVACVYSHPLSKGGSSNGHYNGNAETYMNVGEAMGKAMVELVPSTTASNNLRKKDNSSTSGNVSIV